MRNLFSSSVRWSGGLAAIAVNVFSSCSAVGRRRRARCLAAHHPLRNCQLGRHSAARAPPAAGLASGLFSSSRGAGPVPPVLHQVRNAMSACVRWRGSFCEIRASRSEMGSAMPSTTAASAEEISKPFSFFEAFFFFYRHGPNFELPGTVIYLFLHLSPVILSHVSPPPSLTKWYPGPGTGWRTFNAPSHFSTRKEAVSGGCIMRKNPAFHISDRLAEAISEKSYSHIARTAGNYMDLFSENEHYGLSDEWASPSQMEYIQVHKRTIY